MLEINDFLLNDLPKAFTKNALTVRYFGLIEGAAYNCDKIDDAGIKRVSDLFRVINSDGLEVLANKTGVSKDYLLLLYSLMKFHKYKPVPLKKMEEFEPKYIESLCLAGINKTSDLLLSCKSEGDRVKLSRKTNVPLECLIRMAKLADLMRLPGVKNIRAILYCDAGFDTVEKFATLNVQEARDYLINYIRITSNGKTPPFPKELETQIVWAKICPVIVNF